MTETPQEAYDRGHVAGGIEARLDAYDQHFAAINGSVADTAAALTALSMQVQRLADQAVADAATRISTAAAVEKARTEAAAAIESERLIRKQRSESTWSPFARGIAVVGSLVALISLYLTYLALKR